MSEPTPEQEPWHALLRYVGVGDVDDDFVKDCWDQAVALVDRYVGSASVPAPLMRNAYVQTGSELYARKDAPSGITSFADGMPSPVRLARDPMTSVYPMLRRFVGGRFA